MFHIRLRFLWWLSFLPPPPIKQSPIVLYQSARCRIAVPLRLEGLNARTAGENIWTKHDGEGDGCHFVLVRVFGHPDQVLDEVVEHVVVCGG